MAMVAIAEEGTAGAVVQTASGPMCLYPNQLSQAFEAAAIVVVIVIVVVVVLSRSCPMRSPPGV